MALRLGLRLVKGLAKADAERLAARRGDGYADVADLARRGELSAAALAVVARADAFRSLGLDRRQAAWAVRGLEPAPLPLFAAAASATRTKTEPEVALPEMALGEHVAEDYATLRLSLKRHPVAFVRAGLAADGIVAAAALADIKPGRRVSVAGLVTIRQRPATAAGVVFVTIEDETGVANLIVRPHLCERFRRPLLGAVLLAATGRLERDGIVIHVLVESLADLTPRLAALTAPEAGVSPPAPPAEPALAAASRDFR